jgi:nucleoside-diphosphate-sugar epimerase
VAVVPLPHRRAQAVVGTPCGGTAYLDNYFSIAKAQRDLGYRPLFTTDRAMAECLPYYVDLFRQMKGAAA